MNQILCTKDEGIVETIPSKNIVYVDKWWTKEKIVILMLSFTTVIFALFLTVKAQSITNNSEEQIEIVEHIAEEEKSSTENVEQQIQNSETTDEKEEAIEIVESINEVVPTETNLQTNESTIENSNSNYTATNTKNYDTIATLSIPSQGIEYPILSSTSTNLLNISLNKYWGANPNEVGNMVVVGHNYRDNSTRMFSRLNNVKIGDVVKITDLTGRTLDYIVYETNVINPYDNSCTSQLTNGHTEVTLITCYNKGTQRFVVKARAN